MGGPTDTDRQIAAMELESSEPPATAVRQLQFPRGIYSGL